MEDFFSTATSLDSSANQLDSLLLLLYKFKPVVDKDIFLALNLQWPKFNLPKNYKSYVISYHTEYMDLSWTIQQCREVYPKPVLLITDYEISVQHPWPDNIIAVRYITFAQQIQIALEKFGIAQANDLLKPKYKVSSLSHRVSQSKKFITAYLLKNFQHDQMILTYHDYLGKQEDHHGYPPEFDIFDNLELNNLCKTRLNFVNDNQQINQSPISNTNWHNSAYQDALINFTNESFHYSRTVFEEQDFEYPGPYLTEKTFKPLLAGRPFLPVGQAGIGRFLNSVGIATDFGFDMTFDQDTGDLSRMIKIFKTIDDIKTMSLDDLYDHSLEAVKHNLQFVANGGLLDICDRLNQPSVKIIKDFITKHYQYKI